MSISITTTASTVPHASGALVILSASGATAPVTWAITDPAAQLPPGMALINDGRIVGTPQAVGAYAFTVRATDNASPPAFASTTFTLTVS